MVEGEEHRGRGRYEAWTLRLGRMAAEGRRGVDGIVGCPWRGYIIWLAAVCVVVMLVVVVVVASRLSIWQCADGG